MNVDLSTLLVQETINAVYGKLLESYQVPSSAQGVFWDFYTLSYLSTVVLDHTHKAYKGSLLGDVDDVKEKLDDAEQKLLPNLRERLLNGLFLSICSEIRHALEHSGIEAAMKKLSPEQRALFKKYWRRQKLHGGSSNKLYVRRRELKKPPGATPRESAYLNSWRAATAAVKSAGKDAADFVRVCEVLFRQPIWASQYGGPAWAGICRGYHRLNEARTPSQLFVAIDHVFDLEHNTGSALNKSEEWSGSWLKKSLDFKFKAKIEEIVAKSSIQMKSLARRVMKNAGLPLGDIEYEDKKAAAAAAGKPAPTSAAAKPAAVTPAAPAAQKNTAENFISELAKVTHVDIGSPSYSFPPADDVDTLRSQLHPLLDTEELKKLYQDNEFEAWKITFSKIDLSLILVTPLKKTSSKKAVFVFSPTLKGAALSIPTTYTSAYAAAHAIAKKSNLAMISPISSNDVAVNQWLSNVVSWLHQRIPGGISGVKYDFPTSGADDARSALSGVAGKGKSENYDLYELNFNTDDGQKHKVILAGTTDFSSGFLWRIWSGSAAHEVSKVGLSAKDAAIEIADLIGYARSKVDAKNGDLNALHVSLLKAIQLVKEGPHWTDGTLEKLSDDLCKKYPDNAGKIEEWFHEMDTRYSLANQLGDEAEVADEIQAIKEELRAIADQICGVDGKLMASAPADQSQWKPLDELYHQLTEVAMEYSSPGPHWSNGTVYKLRDELKTKFPEKAKEIGQWFDDLGELSNLLSEITDESSREEKDAANEQYTALKNIARAICGISSK